MTLRFPEINERNFVRQSPAKFKQGILFKDWPHSPQPGKRHRASPRSAVPMTAYSSLASSASDYLQRHIIAGDGGAWLAR